MVIGKNILNLNISAFTTISEDVNAYEYDLCICEIELFASTQMRFKETDYNFTCCSLLNFIFISNIKHGILSYLGTYSTR